MKFANTTQLPAGFLAGSIGDNEQIAIVVCKVTYVKDRGGGLTPVAPDCMWPVFQQPTLVDGVTLQAELDFRRRGIDIIVFGDAVAPHGQPVPRMQVAVRCGSVDYRVDVIGDRRWIATSKGMRMSNPLPFVSMPLTNDRAFGGEALVEGNPLPHPANPVGRGYCYSRDEVNGKVLPNLEQLGAPIRSWNDQPPPACLYKPQGIIFDRNGPCSIEGIANAADPKTAMAALAPRALSQTVPELICPEGELGRELTLSGFDALGDLVFPLPPARSVPGQWGPSVHPVIGGRRSRFGMSVVTIVAFAAQRAIVVAYRAVFRYLFEPEQPRSASLRWSGPIEVSAAQGELQ